MPWLLGLALAALRRPEQKLGLASAYSHAPALSLVGRGVVIHDHARAVAADSAADMECSRNTGETCLFSECSGSVMGSVRGAGGNVTCEAGVCTCVEGLCTDGHGACVSSDTGEWLDETRTLKATGTDQYIYLSSHGGAELAWSVNDKSSWHVLVNSDGTIVLRNMHFANRYLGVLLDCHSEVTKSRVHCAVEMEASSPSDVAFEAVKFKTGSKAVPGQGVVLRHVKTGYYLGDHLHAYEFDWNGWEWDVEPPLPDRAIRFSEANGVLAVVLVFFTIA